MIVLSMVQIDKEEFPSQMKTGYLLNYVACSLDHSLQACYAGDWTR